MDAETRVRLGLVTVHPSEQEAVAAWAPQTPPMGPPPAMDAETYVRLGLVTVRPSEQEAVAAWLRQEEPEAQRRSLRPSAEEPSAAEEPEAKRRRRSE